MKLSPDMRKIQERMQPGVITRDGFLGNDRRNLVDILEEDDAEVRRMGLTHQEIANQMLYFKEQGLRGLGEFITVPPHFEVRVDSARGKLPCPFGDPGIFQKTNTTVRNLKLGKEITYTDLHIHMIGSHGFYEGRGFPFRIDPVEIVEVLEIAPREES